MESLFTTVFEYIHVWLFGILKVRKSWPITGVCTGLGILFWWMAETEKITNIQFWFLFTGILAAEAFLLYLMHRFPVGEARWVNQIWKNYSENQRKAYEELLAVREKRLFPKEHKQYLVKKYFLLIQFGAYEKAEHLLKQYTKEDDAEYQMFLSFKEERAGKLEKAVEHMQKAKAAVKDTDFFLKTQILCNYGRLMVLVGNFTEADFYFIKARDLANANKKKELLHPIYYNLLINWCKLGKSREEVERGLRDYYFRLDMEQMDHILEFNNLQVILARQMEDYELLHRRIGEGFEEMLRLPLTKEQRLVYLGSMARMVCTARSNPERCLEEIEKEIDGMFRMQMPERYWILKQIGYMFGPLYYPKYDGIRVKVNEYLDRQAEDDIRDYMQKLPEECVFERCQLWEELSGLASRNPDTYDFTTVLRNMEWSRDTLLRNGLYLNAALVDTHMAEECAAPWNLDDNMIPIHHKEMLEYVEHAEALLADARQHPEMQEAWLYLSYQSYHLMRYEKCREHFRRFRSFHISLAHFTPEFQQIYAGCAMINHILDFYFAWKDLEKNTHRQQALSEEARMWFQKPVQQRKVDLCMLLAKHMGYKGVRLKHSFWFEKAGESVVQKAHCWLLTNEGGLEVDLLYDLFPLEEEPQRLLFMEGRHPMETDESVTIIRGRETGLVVKDHVICRWYAFDETFEKSVLGEVWKSFNIYIFSPLRNNNKTIRN